MSNNILINKDFSNILCNELFSAISKGKQEKIDDLINLGVDINFRDTKGRNALFWAIYHRQINIIKKLLELGVSTKVTSSLTAINYAVYKNDVKVLKCLKNCGLDLNELDDVNSTALIYAVLYNKIKSVDYLVENNACVKHEDMLGNSALSLAYDLKIQYLIKKFESLV
ncbi:ankyrin repeat domain-containing protein [Arcobacter roscoffensis]|uniref:Ankyrin repeat domain-containing protein n=1 Tax=Arcobacter roscoffensis TaxID=2961520 RepID=A0ABY5E195_9BACT|nr:ankyrin repeat domain-containing protein [Arcobacter roscoffensis]UTJ05496.1 ankyrin repeat domain-containing protein [Arcobacter roscoffensis]|tara:strand:+ start:1239 stop:1745 length:507 start_codon:yes stop_codon:yes gene_type:complete